jgi:protein TonB
MGISTIILAIAGIAVILTGLIFAIRKYSDPVKIGEKYANSEERKSIFIKKYKEADIEYYKGPVMRVGLIAVLLTLILAFNYSNRKKSDGNIYNIDQEEIIEQDIPVTQQVQPPPPPPPPPPPQIEVVEDEEIIEDAPVIEDLEVKMDEEVVAKPVKVEVEIVEEPEPEPEEPEIFTVVEQQPEFPGGQGELLAYLGKNINYPPIAQENGIEGTVVVRFVVNETGGISDIQIVRDIGGGCGAEAVRVVKSMPKWKPGRQRGKAVKVYFTLPVRFKLE